MALVPRDLNRKANRQEMLAAFTQNKLALEEAQDTLAAIEVTVAALPSTMQGTATITSGTEVTVTHNFGASGYKVAAAPNTDLGAGKRFWVGAKGSNDFTIFVDSSVTSKSFDWILSAA